MEWTATAISSTGLTLYADVNYSSDATFQLQDPQSVQADIGIYEQLISVPNTPAGSARDQS